MVNEMILKRVLYWAFRFSFAFHHFTAITWPHHSLWVRQFKSAGASVRLQFLCSPTWLSPEGSTCPVVLAALQLWVLLPNVYLITDIMNVIRAPFYIWLGIVFASQLRTLTAMFMGVQMFFGRLRSQWSYTWYFDKCNVCCGVSVLQTGNGARSTEMSFLRISDFLFN
jgi:hypothetical protein